MYFIDTDTRENEVYIVPFKQLDGSEYVILAENGYKANELKRKLLAGLILGPLDDSAKYEEIKIISRPPKKLKVYRYLG